MKFLCDRCKTRYSIGDDRVRGKILKIRCKNCANVITVREGMTADPDGAADAGRAKKATTVAPMPLPDERDAIPGREAPRPRASGTESPGAAGGARELAARPASGTASPREPVARQPARAPGAAAPAKKPQRPDDAARGQGKRSPAADGARGEPNNAQAFASAMAKPPPAALQEEWYVSIDGDQAGPFSLVEAQRWVSQKPFDAELHCWNEGFDDWLPVDKVSHFRGLRKRPSPSAAPPLPRVGGVAPMALVAPVPIEGPKPAFAATVPRQASPALQPASALRAPGFDERRESRGGDPAGDRPHGIDRPAAGRSNGALRNAPLGAPFDTSEDSDVGTELEATRYRDPSDPARIPPAAGTPAPSGSMAAVSPPAMLDAGVVSAPASDFESDAHMGDELHIGEVSRVVNLADLRPPARGNRAPSPSGRLPTFGGRAQGFRAPTNGGMVPGAASVLQPAASEAAPVPAAKSHRRGLLVLLGVAAVMLLGVAAAVLLLVINDDEPTGGSLGQVRNIDTSRPEDPIGQRPPEPGAPGPGSARPTTPAPVAPRPTAPRPTAPTGSNQPDAPGNPLRYDEIEDIARKHQDTTQRCYMRSQRGADAILVGEVKKIAVTLTIDRDGNVSDLQLSDHAADNLGKCLLTSIKAWKFRPSSGGTFKFSLNFVSG